jgi:hypothetical protein
MNASGMIDLITKYLDSEIKSITSPIYKQYLRLCLWVFHNLVISWSDILFIINLHFFL